MITAMKYITLTLVLIFTFGSWCMAEEPRTVGVYKRHISSDDHNPNDFDHKLHHLLYLSGVADAYRTVNKMRKENNQPPLYCQPETISLSGTDVMEILNKKLHHPERPAADDLTVSEALLQALQDEYPCAK